MPYSTQSIIDIIFGVHNATMPSSASVPSASWADVDNDGDATKIAARIARAIAVADADIDARLRGTSYKLPIVSRTDGSTTPTLIEEISGVLAGMWLYEARVSADVGESGKVRHPLSFRKAWAYDTLEQIATGKIKLYAVLGN